MYIVVCVLYVIYIYIYIYIYKAGVLFVNLRPTWFMQNLLNEADGIKQGKVIYRPQTYGYKQTLIDARDIAEAAAVILSADKDLGKYVCIYICIYIYIYIYI